MASYESLMVFTGNANPQLAENVVHHLGMSLGRANVGKFSDGETAVELLENVRGRDVFILQPTCMPTSDNLMEVLVIADTLKRASAGRITAAIPYFGYARQDRRPRSARVPITAKLVANMLDTAGIDRILTVDLHADQIQGFFNIPVDNIYATPVLIRDIQEERLNNIVVVSPDIGGVVRARAAAKAINADLAIIDKRRPKANVAEIMNIIGEVQGKCCLLFDDMIDTANTLCQAATALKEQGADKVLAYATHPVLSGEAVKRINASIIDKVVVTDTIPLSENAKKSKKIKQISISGVLAETIRRISNEESVSYLFNDNLAKPGALFLP
ncbi:MAG: ribose-phosphate pyrophosphokinase [Haemophilus parainfluenzae]|jgi:ribose-phosphate diphosphokinase|nr:MAG: ribose-phosphate pyrophosphokinase [Haemophilus parainfluenzae]